LTADNFDWIKEKFGDKPRELYWWDEDKLTVKQKNSLENMAAQKLSITFYFSSVWWICRFTEEQHEAFTSALDHKQHDKFCDEFDFENRLDEKKVSQIPEKHINKYPPFYLLRNTNSWRLSSLGYKWYLCEEDDMDVERRVVAKTIIQNGFAICLSNMLFKKDKIEPTRIYYFYFTPRQYVRFLAGRN